MRVDRSTSKPMLGTCVIVLFVSAMAHAQPTIDDFVPNTESIEIPVNKSVIVKLKDDAEKVSVVAPEIADVHIVEPRQILITAMSVGETSLIIWTAQGGPRMIDIHVKWNTQAINQTLRDMLPDQGVKAVSIENAVALRGSAKSLAAANQAMEITKAYAPKVLNMIDMPGEQQVLLKVKIAEVASSFRHKEGFNFLINNDDVIAGSKLNNLISGDFASGDVTMSDVVTTFFSFPGSDVSGFIQALKEKGWLHILAEPNLVAHSGATASFLAGGEFPIPVSQGTINNAITIEYKEFGVQLQFTPTVLDQKTIRMDIAPEVSDLDFSQGVTISGFTVPTVITRRTHTVVELNEGQTFAIAGLINQTSRKTDGKIPYLGDIPVLGALFRSKEITEQDTELLIMVTPYLVSGLEGGENYPMPQPPFQQNRETPKPPKKQSRSPKEPKLKQNNIDEIELGGLKPHGVAARVD